MCLQAEDCKQDEMPETLKAGFPNSPWSVQVEGGVGE